MSETKPILLVDDSSADVALAMEALTELALDQHVDVARGGEEALAFLRKTRGDGSAPAHPCLVILDLKMPRMNGFDVLGAIRADPSMSRVPVVVLSTSADRSDVDRCYALGANGYVVKSLSFGEFSERLQSIGKYWCGANVPPGGCVAIRT